MSRAGLGNGTFQAPMFYNVGYQYFFTIATGDFNSDGNTDIIVQHYVVNNDFGILLGNGDGTFHAPEVQHNVGAETGSIVPADFNNDGLLDFAYANIGSIYLQQ